MKLIISIILLLLLPACVKFSGTDLEISTGTEQGTDQGSPTHKMLYGTLLRLRFDVKDNK